MRWSFNLERSYAVAGWLFAVAALVVVVLVVGGATRLTGSGLSITEWKPVGGVIPPLSAHGWQVEFDHYKRIPQYREVNLGLTLAEFKPLFWWEWSHRMLGRLVGLAVALPLLAFLILRRIPKRLIWRCAAIFVLVLLQGLVGWWMVASGLERRVSVAPERLAVHLGLALLLYAACVWTGLEAWFGRGRGGMEPARRYALGAPLLASLAYVQCLLGALVAGGRAGLIDQDWPMMAGRVFPEGYVIPSEGVLGSMLHSPAAAQFDHRIGGYVLLLASLAFALAIGRDRLLAGRVRGFAWLLFAGVCLQAGLGVATLWAGDPAWLGGVHQLGAVAVLTLALVLAWRTRRT